MLPSSESRHDKSGLALVAIGIFKLVKSITLFALGIGLVYWRGQDIAQVASEWINTFWLGRRFVDRIISELSSFDEKTLQQIAAGSFVYAALLLTEGVGLCLRKRWAEFLTVGITASLLPFECYELYQRFTATRVAITLVNIAIVVYLIMQLADDDRGKRIKPNS